MAPLRTARAPALARPGGIGKALRTACNGLGRQPVVGYEVEECSVEAMHETELRLA